MKTPQVMLAGLVLAILGGCGTEGINDTPPTSPPAAEGLWTGALGFSPAKPASMLVLNNGSLWMVYAKPGSTDVGGVIQASGGNPNDSSYTATSAEEFNLQGLTGPNNINLVSTALVAGSKFWGNLAYPASPSVVFAFQTAYNLNNTGSLPAASGTFTGTTGSKAGLTISSTESLSLTVLPASAPPNIIGTLTSGCTVSGSIAPLAGINAYSVSLTFSGASGTCANTTGSAGAVAGVAFIDDNGKLNILALNAARSNGFVFRQN